MTRSMPRKARTMGIGVLPILAGLLMASGLLRLGDGPVATTVAELVSSRTAHAAPSAPAPPEDGIAEILTELNARQAELDERTADLDAEAARIAEGRVALRAQLEAVEIAETELRELLQMADKAADDDLSRLAQIYSAMKPAEAAALFQQMPPDFAAGFLGMMAPPASAAILAGMPPDAAFAVSVVLAGRHADLPKE